MFTSRRRWVRPCMLRSTTPASSSTLMCREIAGFDTPSLPGVVEHPEDGAEGLGVPGAPRLEERPGVLVVHQLGLARVVRSVGGRTVALVDPVGVDPDVVEDAVRLAGVVVR